MSVTLASSARPKRWLEGRPILVDRLEEEAFSILESPGVVGGPAEQLSSRMEFNGWQFSASVVLRPVGQTLPAVQDVGKLLLQHRSQDDRVQRLIVVGPAGSGKTMLCKQLVAFTALKPEYNVAKSGGTACVSVAALARFSETDEGRHVPVLQSVKKRIQSRHLEDARKHSMSGRRDSLQALTDRWVVTETGGPAPRLKQLGLLILDGLDEATNQDSLSLVLDLIVDFCHSHA
eukprot:CAMPEP_0204310950 /NCGR_PEP_ID=MMETSP0469-20131031/2040_1 /ASSEMBLY_ACC=CAM_ASM_000384 /TAXON_ID=2969 /ORGANISM="Oxyrrhis marina" /LENGTH=232 /DNA_ID=CAMNT_0051290811 /DNA_START=36 /DNA_END=730 /DNA_ORIENTATION=+